MKARTVTGPAGAVGARFIDESLAELATDQAFVRALTWWARHGSSHERLLQTYWGQHLDRLIQARSGSTLAVTCEQRYWDLVFYDPAEPGHHDTGYVKPVAAIELKAWGGWSVGNPQLADFLADVDHVRSVNMPAAAVATCVHIERPTRWMSSSKTATADAAEIGRRMTNFRGLKDLGFSSRTFPPVDAGTWGSLSLSVWTYCNEHCERSS